MPRLSTAFALITSVTAAPSTAAGPGSSRKQTPAVEWFTTQVRGDLDAVLAGAPGTIARDLPNGALAALVLDGPTPRACGLASTLLHRFGDRYDMSFGGQALPPILHNFSGCFNKTEQQWLAGVINRSLPMTTAEATPQEVSYTNMWLMSTVNSILYGELAGPTSRGSTAARVGYSMLEQWAGYTDSTGVHEFTSPTYTYVQLTALYTGYIHAADPHYREVIKRALDLLWAALAANWFAPQSALSGPHSRDYDTLLGHGMLLMEAYLHGLPNAAPMACEVDDPHCEGPVAGVDPAVGTGEPMTVGAISLYNYWHPRGYRPGPDILALADVPVRTVQHRFLGQNSTANGNSDRFGQTYNYVVGDAYAIGSASQDYITNTHHQYWPNPQDKLVNILLDQGSTGGTGNSAPHTQRPLQHRHSQSSDSSSAGSTSDDGHSPQPRPRDVLPRRTAQISVQPDWMDSPYGVWKLYPGNMSRLGKASHLAVHPGNVQHENALLSTLALNGNDALDGFSVGNLPLGQPNRFTSLATNVLLPLRADELEVRWPNGSVVQFTPWANPSTPFVQALPVGSTLGVRVNAGMLAVRVFACDGVDGSQGNLSLQGDATGLRLSAIRLVCRHLASPTPVLVPDRNLRWGALMVADRWHSNRSDPHMIASSGNVRAGDANGTQKPAGHETAHHGVESLTALVQRVAAAPVASVTAGGVWKAETTVAGTNLAVERELGCTRGRPANATWNCLNSLRINGSDVLPPTGLVVNGKRVSMPLVF